MRGLERLIAIAPCHDGTVFIRATNLENGKSVVLTINDRMARRNSNIIDVTRRAARKVGFEKQGTTRVSVEPVQ